ncbi:UNVERIFIED_CONTAM: Scarecrow-like protein 14 [Sesamum latifolium]|uniref:Scarecrow-like protein 14 n=1 Tax=Sesamum latifolium TaxID=2727402 RepID=A0AAW2TB79_9LAMI
MCRIKFNNQAVPVSLDPNMIDYLRVSDRFLDRNIVDNMPVSSQFSFGARGQSSDGEYPEDFDFSDVVLKYINHILMEEDVEDKTCMFQESAALQAAEKSFYEVLGEQYPASTDYQLLPNLDLKTESPDDKVFGELKSYCGSGDMGALCLDWHTDPNWNGIDGHHVTDPDIFRDKESAMQFKKGVEEARKFLPSGSKLIVDMKYDKSVEKEQKEGPTSMVVKVEKNINNEESSDLSRERRIHTMRAWGCKTNGAASNPPFILNQV